MQINKSARSPKGRLQAIYKVNSRIISGIREVHNDTPLYDPNNVNDVLKELETFMRCAFPTDPDQGLAKYLTSYYAQLSTAKHYATSGHIEKIDTPFRMMQGDLEKIKRRVKGNNDSVCDLEWSNFCDAIAEF